jgi:hypothetical protein
MLLGRMNPNDVWLIIWIAFIVAAIYALYLIFA